MRHHILRSPAGVTRFVDLFFTLRPLAKLRCLRNVKFLQVFVKNGLLLAINRGVPTCVAEVDGYLGALKTNQIIDRFSFLNRA